MSNEVPAKVVEYLREGNDTEDLCALIWELLTPEQREELCEEAM